MRCDECRFWKERYRGIDWAYGECTEIVGFIDIGTNGDGVTDIETDADFFCAAFEVKDDE